METDEAEQEIGYGHHGEGRRDLLQQAQQHPCHNYQSSSKIFYHYESHW